MTTATTAMRPATVATVRLTRGARRLVRHVRRRGVVWQVLERTVAPEIAAVLATVLERDEPMRLAGEGASEASQARIAEWLTEHVPVGERHNAIIGVVITDGKGLGIAAASDEHIAAAVEAALCAAEDAYLAVARRRAVVRLGRAAVPTAIAPQSLRSAAITHRANAAGEPHWHRHILIGAAARADSSDDKHRQIWARAWLRDVAQEAQTAARLAMLQVLRAAGIPVDPLSLDLVGLDEDDAAVLEEFSTVSSLVRRIEGGNHAISQEAAWRAARQALNAPGRSPLEPRAAGLDVAIRAWAARTWRLQLARPDGTPVTYHLKLSRIEALEHAIDSLLRCAPGREAWESWLEATRGRAWRLARRAVMRALRRADPQRPLNDAVLADYVWRIAGAIDDGARITPAALEGHVDAILAAHPGADATAVRAAFATAFVHLPSHRYVTPVASLRRDIRALSAARAALAPARTPEQALRIERGLAILGGVAGSGKTARVRAAAQDTYASRTGTRIWCLARNALTAKELAAAVREGIETAVSTPGSSHRPRVVEAPLARVLAGRSRPRAGDTILVDEFALCDADHLAWLVARAEAGCAVVLIGDAHQLAPISGAQLAWQLAALAERERQPVLRETVRCAAWRELHDLVRAAPDDETARRRAIDLLDLREAHSLDDVVTIALEARGGLVITATNELASELAERIERARRAGEPDQLIAVRDGALATVGSSVVARCIVRDASDAPVLLTGEVGVIIDADSDRVVVRVSADDADRTVVLSRAQARGLALADAVTADAAQGRTVARAIVVVTGHEDAHWLYSAATRGRSAPIVVVLPTSDDPEASTRLAEVRELLGVEVDSTPRAVLEHVLSRSERERGIVELLDDDAMVAALADVLEHHGLRGIEDLAGRTRGRSEDVSEDGLLDALVGAFPSEDVERWLHAHTGGPLEVIAAIEAGRYGHRVRARWHTERAAWLELRDLLGEEEVARLTRTMQGGSTWSDELAHEHARRSTTARRGGVGVRWP